jgi:DNA sulfur modification protein DndE
VRNSWNAQNGDGIDINACHNVVIYNCTVDVGDDGICLKLGKPEKSRGWEVACENIVIADCVVYRAHGGFVIGSNTDGGARNISVRNCIFNGTDIGLRFKSGRGRGGLVENISIDGIVMNNIVNDAILFDLYYINTGVGTDPGISIKKPEVPSSEKNMPIFQKFFMKNIVCQGAERAVFINSLPEKCIKEIDFKDITISAKKGVSCTNGENLHFTNVSIMANHSPIYEFNECRNITIDHSIYTEGTEVFLKAEGKQSENIQIIKTDISKAKKGIELSGDAKPDAVIQR